MSNGCVCVETVEQATFEEEAQRAEQVCGGVCGGRGERTRDLEAALMARIWASVDSRCDLQGLAHLASLPGVDDARDTLQVVVLTLRCHAMIHMTIMTIRLIHGMGLPPVCCS
jgi:hypothetical protein